MQREQDRTQLLRSFLEVGAQIAGDLEIEQVLLTIIDRSMTLTSARYGAAVTIGPDGAIQNFLHRGLTPEEVALLPHYPEGRGLLGMVLEEQVAFRVDNIADHPASVGFPVKHVPMAAFLGVPLKHHGILVGALYLTKPPNEPPFSSEDEELLTALGRMAAIGVSNARLFAAESERAERSGLLREIASRVRRSLDTDQVLAATVEELGRAAGVDRCFIRLVTEEGGHTLGPLTYEWNASGSAPMGHDPQRQYPVGSLAAVTRRTQWSNDVTADERLDRPDLQGTVTDLLEAGIHSVVSSPLEWGDELLGVVSFHNKQPRVWTDVDIELIEGAAREVAVALHHARLYTRAVETADELARLDELRRDFVAVVSHELRSPMTVISGIADLLLKRSASLPEDTRKELVETLGRESRRLNRLVSDVLDLEAIDHGRVHFATEDVDLGDLVRESIQDAGESARVNLVIEPGNPLISVDRDRVKQVLLNLLSNAFKFSAEDAPVAVTVRPDDGGATVSVRDEGPGLTDEEQTRLFQRFTRLGGQQSGSGLGLYLSKALVERHGGRIWVESKLDEGSTFSFFLPRREG
ncbi:MAG: GAF domain-containing protein [Actinomycetota bacterium]|nr:GAF domain-containing protein [Actinomycetota bacterium]